VNCKYCGIDISKLGSIEGFCYPCSDKALAEWLNLKIELEQYKRALDLVVKTIQCNQCHFKNTSCCGADKGLPSCKKKLIDYFLAQIKEAGINEPQPL
jgi:hypothetical protein